MRASVTPGAGYAPNRYLATPRRPPEACHRGAEILGGLAAVALTAQALAAPAVLLAAGALIAVGRVSRWRFSWLLVPFALSIWWLGEEGLRTAVAALASGSARLVSAERAVAMRPARLLHPGALGAGPARWLLPQLPLALAAGTAEAAVILLAWWHRRGRPPWRPGILAVARGRVAAAGLRAGRSVTAHGCAIGVTATGRRAELTWKAAESGVVVTGYDDCELAGPAAAVLCAAIRRRKTVVVIDLRATPRPSGLARQAATMGSWLGVPVTALSAAPGDVTRVIGRAVSEREVVVAAADAAGSAGRAAIGALTGVLTRLRDAGLRADCVAVIAACEHENPAAVAALLSVAGETGTAVLLLTTSPACAAGLAESGTTTIACGSLPPLWLQRLAGLAAANQDAASQDAASPDAAGHDPDAAGQQHGRSRWARAAGGLTSGELAIMRAGDRAVVRARAVTIDVRASR